MLMTSRPASFMRRPSPVLIYSAPSLDEMRHARASFSRAWCLRGVGLSQGLIQPGAGVGPGAVRRAPGQAEGGGRLLKRQAGEEAQLDQLGAAGVLPGEAVQALVQRGQVVVV